MLGSDPLWNFLICALGFTLVAGLIVNDVVAHLFPDR